MVPTLPTTQPQYKIAFYFDKKDIKPVPNECSWEELVEGLTSFEASPCTTLTCAGKNCPHKSKSSKENKPMCWSPVEIYGDRVDINVKSIALLVLDFDHLTKEQLSESIAALSPYQHILHTTHNHRETDICFRAIVALSRRVNANQWHRFLAAAVKMLNVPADPTCKNRSRYYYLPSHPHDVSGVAKSVQGAVLDVDAVLAWADANMPPNVSQALTAHSEATEGKPGVKLELSSEAVQDAIKCGIEHFPGVRRHEVCLALGGMLKIRGILESDAHHIVYQIAKGGESEEPETRAATVAATYGRDRADAVTGFSRVCEIIGVEAAEEFGAYLDLAVNEAFLRNIKKTQEPTNIASGPPKVIDTEVLRKKIVNLAGRKDESPDYDDKITAVLLKRVLKGETLAQPKGAGDVETALKGEVVGIDQADAIRKVMSSIAFTLPTDTPWEVVKVLTQQTFSATSGDWEKLAKNTFNKSQSDRKVQDEKRASEYTLSITAPKGENEPPDGKNWHDLLIKSPKGEIVANPLNVTLFLKNHPHFCGHIRWNEVTKSIGIYGGPLKDSQKSEIFVDIEDHIIKLCGSSIGNFETIKRRIFSAARKNSFDPIKDYLLGLKWDRINRLDTWLFDYADAVAEDGDEKEYVSTVGRRWLIAAVARGLKPGCKCDTMLIFEAEQGEGKSTLFKDLGGEWFSDSELNLKDKDARMVAGSKWIVEMAELNGFKTADDSRRKAFLSQQVDNFRPPYGAETEDFPRRAIFCGTTNKGQYLTDETGNRRYWCVRVPNIRTGKLRKMRDQLFAEATCLYLAAQTCEECSKLREDDSTARCTNHRWWLSKTENKKAEKQAEKREEEVPYMLEIDEWWRGLKSEARPKRFTADEVAIKVLDFDRSRVDQKTRMQIGHAMKKLSFTKKRGTADGDQHWFFVPTAEQLAMETKAAVERVSRPAFVVAPKATNVLPLPASNLRH